MKKILILLVIGIVLALPVVVSAANIKDAPGDNVGISPKDMKNAKEIQVKYKEKKGIDTILKELLPFLPIDAAETIISVEIDGAVVAELPPDSKYVGIKVHDVCLKHLYGTRAWYECEEILK